MQRYPIPACEVRTEIQVLNSRFVATAAPVLTVDQAKEFVARIRREFADATDAPPWRFCKAVAWATWRSS